MDKTRDSTNSKIWPDSTCAISVRRKGQILLVVESLVLSTTVILLWNFSFGLCLLQRYWSTICHCSKLRKRKKICLCSEIVFSSNGSNVKQSQTNKVVSNVNTKHPILPKRKCMTCVMVNKVMVSVQKISNNLG